MHEPQPAGLTEATLYRKDGQPLGISIHGGVRSPSANPLDQTDEGVFIDKVGLLRSTSALIIISCSLRVPI